MYGLDPPENQFEILARFIDHPWPLRRLLPRRIESARWVLFEYRESGRIQPGENA
jgi:hypothetical protein